jgi:hypothetical protein
MLGVVIEREASCQVLEPDVTFGVVMDPPFLVRPIVPLRKVNLSFGVAVQDTSSIEVNESEAAWDISGIEPPLLVSGIWAKGRRPNSMGRLVVQLASKPKAGGLVL